jgi:hypothetical protein
MWRRPLDLVELVPMPPLDPDLPDVIGDRYPPTGPIVARGQGIVAPKYWAAEAYATLLARTMRAVAAEGNVVIVGRGGNEALAGAAGVLRVLVMGSEGMRIRRLAQARGVTGFDARDVVRQSDRRRAAFSRQFHGEDWLDPRRYDLVVNTDSVNVEAAAEIIVQAARVMATGGGDEAAATSAPAAATP